jgi:Pyruvate/2-oxoacid:ferredoxin oxidoreductase gamma subunit
VIADRHPLHRLEVKYQPELVLDTLGLAAGSKPLFHTDKSFIANFKEQRLRIAGFGGQGVLMAGTTLGLVAMEHGLQASWLPSYGPEMRGGTANCHVVLASSETGSPVVDDPNVLIAMNQPSLDEFEPLVQKGGLIIVNSSIISREVGRTDVTVVKVPMNKIADGAGIAAAANMAAVAAYIIHTKAMPVEHLKVLIQSKFKKKDLIEKNLLVIEKTAEYLAKGAK